MGNNNSTIKEVANRAGVSTATVSHVINKTRYVSDETKRKVQDALIALDFHSSKYAKVLASGKTKTIGLLVSDVGNPFFPKIIRNLEKITQQFGYEVLFFDTNYDATRANEAGISLIEHGVDGVFMMTTETNMSLLNRLTKKHIPVVLLDWGITGDYISNIKENFYKGIEQAVDHLVTLGHKNLAFVSGPLKFHTSLLRKQAFLKALQKNGSAMNEPLLIESNFRIEGGELSFHEITKQRNITAVISSNDLMALGMMSEARKLGYSIPDDFSIIGIDDIFISPFLNPPLTTISIPQLDICEKAWLLMKAFIVDGEINGTETEVDTYLIKRNSSTVPVEFFDKGDTKSEN